MSKQKKQVEKLMSDLFMNLPLEQFVFTEMALNSQRKNFDELLNILMQITPKFCDREDYVDLLIDRTKRDALFEFWYNVSVEMTVKMVSLIEKYNEVRKNV